MQDPAANKTEFNALIQQGLDASQRNDSDAALKLFQNASVKLPQSALPHFLSGGSTGLTTGES